MNSNEALQTALMHHQKGDLKQAEQLYKKVLKRQPANFNALHMLGVLYSQLGNPEAAIRHIEKALQLNPNSYYANYNLGNVFSGLKQFNKAIAYFQKATQLNPNSADSYFSLGNAFKHIGLLPPAMQCYQKVLLIDPTNIHAHYNMGNILLGLREFDKAISCFESVIQRNPDFAEAYNNIGLALHEKGRLDEAIRNYEKAVQVNPKFAAAYSNLGAAVKDKGQNDEAVKYLFKALEIAPLDSDSHNNLGNVFKEKGNIDKAVTYYQKAIRLNANHAEAHFNMGCMLLLSGNFEQGWQEYEWRLKMKHQAPRHFSQLLWDGSDMKGRTMLLYAEQGFGDTIQFIRYVPLVSQRGATVIVECQKELASLIKNVTGIQEIAVYGDKIPECDIYCPLLSLPRLFGTKIETIPAQIPYISLDTPLIRKWAGKTHSEDSRLRVGIVWSGRPTYKGDLYRSMRLEQFLPLSKIDCVTLFSLQKGAAARDTERLQNNLHILDFTEKINDFSDTAAFIENLDLIISVDTAVAHLAGALGKPVWTLLPFVPDWRWMLHREDSPWYPTMRLFRQPSAGDWGSVMDVVAKELRKKIGDT
jgi:tetratricopeptide (TPR) repeat protein